MSVARTFVIVLLGLAAGAGQGQYLETVIPVEGWQARILLNPIANKIYASLYDINKVAIINGATRQVIATPSVWADPQELCLNTISNKVYCRCRESNRLAIIDGVTDTIRRLIIPRGGAKSFAYNATSNRLYVGCDDGYLEVVDGVGDTIMYELRVGACLVYSMCWNPVTNYLFCATAYDSLSVLDCRTDEVRSRWNVDPFDVWCYNPANGRVYTGNSHYLWVFSPRGDSLLATISQAAQYLCAVPFPDKVYIGYGPVFVLDGSTNTIVDTIPVSSAEMVLDTVRAKAYTPYPGGSQVHVIDVRADTLFATISLPAFQPWALCWNPLDGRVYVADGGRDSVYVLRDTTNGVAEASGGTSRQAATSFCSGVYFWPGPDEGRVLDVTGRQVAKLRPGSNDLARLPVGVYTLVGTRPAATMRLVKLR